MDIKSVLNSFQGKCIMSIILGLGLSALFRKACQKRSCLKFTMGKKEDIIDKTFKFNESCYQFDLRSVKCDTNKTEIKI